MLEVRSHIGTYNADWYDVGFHHHPTTVEISIVLEGRGLFEWTESKKTVETGHIIVVPPNMQHRYAAVARVRFGVIQLEGYGGPIGKLLEELVGLNGGTPRLFVLSRLDKERFERLFREWLYVMSSSLKNKQRNYNAWMEMLLLFLIEHSQTEQNAMTVTKAADYIREHLRENVYMSHLADLSGLTVASFRRTFEHMYGLSPKQYQQQCRRQEARWLLSSTDNDIREIAEHVGFSRLHSFSQWFKETEGLSPTAWRKKQAWGETAD